MPFQGGKTVSGHRVSFASIGLLLALHAGPAAAQAIAVESVQSPAWLERGGRSVPLAAGMALEPQDRVRTGANARAALKLRGGGLVKLGPDTE
jgi:hypothetical protein